MFRYHFKALDPEFGTVKEEVCTCSLFNYFNCFCAWWNEDLYLLWQKRNGVDHSHNFINYSHTQKKAVVWQFFLHKSEKKIKCSVSVLANYFLSQAILSFPVSTSWAYLTIPPNKRKQTSPEIKNNYNIFNVNWTNSFLDPSLQYFSVIACYYFIKITT